TRTSRGTTACYRGRLRDPRQRRAKANNSRLVRTELERRNATASTHACREDSHQHLWTPASGPLRDHRRAPRSEGRSDHPHPRRSTFWETATWRAQVDEQKRRTTFWLKENTSAMNCSAASSK